jgi:hypothetical protein
MPSTFADHVNRINSNSPDVVEAEKLWFGTLVENTYLRAPITYRENFAHFKRLMKNRFREEDTNLEYMSSPTTASSPTRPLDCIYPTYFMNDKESAIPRLRPWRSATPPWFSTPNSRASRLEGGYSQEQLAHAFRIIATVSSSVVCNLGLPTHNRIHMMRRFMRSLMRC